jgi:hypothetical protein
LVHKGANEKVRPAHVRASTRSLGAARRRITSISTNAPTSRTAPSRCPRAPEDALAPTPLFVAAERSARIWAVKLSARIGYPATLKTRSTAIMLK